jgi:hypothetical protein
MIISPPKIGSAITVAIEKFWQWVRKITAGIKSFTSKKDRVRGIIIA